MAREPGDRVRTVVQNPSGHTRLPLYLRGRVGRIVCARGSFGFPGDRSRGITNGASQALYTVAFDARDLWGDDAPSGVSICADLFDAYLDEA